MLISEIFSSIDGEGSRSGYLVTFIRTIGCPLRCSYCDTSYAFRPDNNTKNLSIEEIINECISLKNKRITLTGGEPLIQPDIWKLIEKLTDLDFEVNVETSGAVYVDKKQFSYKVSEAYYKGKLFFTYDYKCPSSGMTDKMIDKIFVELGTNDLIKFVVGSAEDLDCMKSVVTKLSPYNHKNQYYVSPVFGKIKPEQIVDYLRENNLHNVRLQLQIHKIIWDPNKRGV